MGSCTLVRFRIITVPRQRTRKIIQTRLTNSTNLNGSTSFAGISK